MLLLRAIDLINFKVDEYIESKRFPQKFSTIKEIQLSILPLIINDRNIRSNGSKFL